VLPPEPVIRRNDPQGCFSGGPPNCMTFGREERDACLRARYAQLDPPLFVIESLVGQNLKAQLFGMERQCTILICYSSRILIST
jgi:hypothetical protein